MASLLTIHLAQAIDLVGLRGVGHKNSTIVDVVVVEVVLLLCWLLVEGGGCDLLIVKTRLAGLVKDSLKAVNKVFVVLVALKYVKTRQNELVLFVNESVQKFNIILVLEVEVRKAVNKLE